MSKTGGTTLWQLIKRKQKKCILFKNNFIISLLYTPENMKNIYCFKNQFLMVGMRILCLIDHAFYLIVSHTNGFSELKTFN